MKYTLPLLLVTLLFAGCATDTGDTAKDKRGRITNAVGQEVFNAVLNFGLSEGRAYVSGQNGQNASQAAFQAAGSLLSAQSVERVMRAAAGPQVAKVSAEAFAAAKPETKQESAFVLNTIGAALQNANNQLAAK